MDDDWRFRLSLLIAWGIFAPMAMRFRIRSVTREKLDRWQEGALILFGLRLSGIPMAVAIIAWMVKPRSVDWAALALPEWLRWLGVALVIGACVLVLWTFSYLGKNLTDTVVTRQEHSLVMRGPYRFVRHPFYLAFVLGALGMTLAMANWFVLLNGLVVFSLLVARTNIEERKLIERFGSEYEDYMRHVGRFVPRFRIGS